MTNRRRAFWATTALATTLLAASAVHAQETTGGIRGQILDANGAPVSGATVLVTHVPTGTVSTTITGPDGGYNARNLRVGGPYEVSATAAGYTSEPTVVASIGIGTPSDVDVYLASGDDASTVADVIVTGAASDRTSPRSRFGLSDLETMPSISRDIKDFVRASPFATVDPTNFNALSIGGQNTRFNAFLVDGVRQGDDFGLNGSGYPTVNSPISISVLEAVSVDVAPYDVQYGAFTGGVVNSVTKSGGNEFEGEAFWETTHDGLRGNSFSYEDFQSGTRFDRPVSGSFEETTWGATLSGPVIKDKLFFLINYEFYESSEPVLTGPEGSGATNEVPGITQAEVDQVRSIVESVYGYDPLDWAADEITVQDEKWFAKLDWNINDRHRAVVSYQQTQGGTLSLNGSSTSSTFPSVGLLSQAYMYNQNLTAYKAQLFSDWSDRLSTELSISRKEVENVSSPLAGSEFAAFQVYLDDPTGPNPRRSIRLGPERSRHANVLTNDLTQFRFVANYDPGFGHRITAGYERETVDVFNQFIQFANAEYEFASIADLQNRQASFIGYQNAATNNKEDGGASFSYTTNTLFVQDDWDVNDVLSVNAGFRIDWFETDDAPLNNPAVLATYGVPNDGTIDGEFIVQPRFGFNWQATDELTIYGGLGRFGGGQPNVWLSNNYTNTGNLLGNFICRINAGYTSNFTGSSVRVCTPAEQAALQNVDGFNVNPIAEQGVTTSAGLGRGAINLLDPNFDMPTIWKASLGATQDFDLSRFGLGDAWNVRVEYVHSEIDKAIGWIDLNMLQHQSGTGPDGRPLFTPINNNQQVLMLTNFEGGATDQLALAVSKTWRDGLFDGLGLDLSYTYLDSTDQNPGTSSTASSNYGNVAVFDPNNPAVATSNYEIEHATKLNVSYQRAFFGDYLTRINLFGQRRSGLPFSYTFDANPQSLVGESYSTRRQLLYVPMVDASGVVTATSDPLVTYGGGFDLAKFNAFLQKTGLIEYAGQITPRNAFKSPDVTTFDLHIEQELPAFFPGRARLSMYADIENLGNLLNDEWGVLQQVGFPYTSGNVAATRAGAQWRFNTFVERDAASFNTQSVWQAKLGVRYKF